MSETIANLASDVFVFWTPFLLLTFIGFQVQKQYLKLLNLVGGKVLVMIPASFSVPIHEVSHYIVAKVCGHNILQVKLFTPNTSGTLGFVKHEYKPGIVSVFTNMFIGLAPLAGGVITIWAITSFLMPDQVQLFQEAEVLTPGNIADVISHYMEVARLVAITHWAQWEFWLWCFLVAHIALFCVPSGADFAGASWGIVVTILFYLLVMFAMGQNNYIHHAFIALATTLTPIFILSTILIICFSLFFYLIHIAKSK